VNELVVSTYEEGLRIALLEQKKIAELHYEKKNTQFAVGDIYLGRVKKILPNLNAVFVDIGFGKDAFLHYPDLGPQFKSLMKYTKSVQASANNVSDLKNFTLQPEIDKSGSIGDVLKSGQTILVQIMKEAISTKGPRLSCQISIPGQYLILLPFSNEVSISRKFKSLDEKKRLKKLLEGIRPANFGYIVRTAAEGIDFEKIEAECRSLSEKWNILSEELAQAKLNQRVMSELDRTSGILRDMLSIGFESIYTDDKEVFQDLNQYLSKHQPENQKKLKFLTPKLGLFEYFGIEKQIKQCFGRNVGMANGAYLVVEHTEALHVIDVNSGSSRNSQNETPEEHALKVNLDAASEIARQLRLRDMGGIIVVDFIDLKKMENRRKVFLHLKAELDRDRAKCAVLPISKFGVVQITRQRVRPEINIQTTEICPSCNGSGKIQPTVLITDEIQANVDFLFRKNQLKKLTIKANPFVCAYLTIGFPNQRWKWMWKYFRWIQILPDTSLPFLTVKYFDEKNEEVKLES